MILSDFGDFARQTLLSIARKDQSVSEKYPVVANCPRRLKIFEFGPKSHLENVY